MHCFKKLVFVVMPLVAFSSGLFAAPASLEQQRQIYQQAQDYLDQKKVNEYFAIRKQIADYPLTPYVDYRVFLIDIGRHTPKEVEEFVAKNRDFPFSNSVKSDYLDALIANEKWDYFYQYQTDEPRMEKYRCSYYTALLKMGETERAFKGASQLWLSGSSISDYCDGLFDEWDKAGLRTDELILKRMLLGAKANNIRLMKYLAKLLKQSKNTQLANEMIHLMENPSYVIEFVQKKTANEVDREKSKIALEKLARTDIELAHHALPIVFQAQEFSAEEQQQVSDYLVWRLFGTDKAYLEQWRDDVLSTTTNVSAIERRIRLAISESDWIGVSKWIAELPDVNQKLLRWQYWQSRSELARGLSVEGHNRLQSILGKRNFYSLAAASELNVPIQFEVSKHRPATENLAPYHSTLVRIKELIDVDKITAAKSEWNWLLSRVSKDEKEALAVYANNKNWHHLSVQATIRAKMWDNIALRFPVAHQWWFNFYAEKHNVNPITLMSVARQESALDSEARSPVGARGIMQIMPATAQYTAKKYQLEYQGREDLFNVGKNIEIGSKYLQSLLEQYDNNRIFAFSAYNAGPQRVKSWREKTNGELDAVAFIESIPFKETRGYVKNILMFEIYYQQIMGIEQPFLWPHEVSTKY